MLQLLCRSTGFSTVPRGQTQYRDLSLTAMVLAIFPWMRVVCDFEHRRWRGESARPSSPCRLQNARRTLLLRGYLMQRSIVHRQEPHPDLPR